MKQFDGYKAEKAPQRETLPAGGYVARILAAKVEQTQNGSEYLLISFDITEGDKANFFRRDYAAQNESYGEKRWRGTYKLWVPDEGRGNYEWSLRAFNNAMYCIEDSNAGYRWDWHEESLKGKNIGVVYREKEWEMPDRTTGEIRTGWTTECGALCTVQEARDGSFRALKPKPLSGDRRAATQANSGAGAQAFVEVDDDELPF